MIFRSAYDDAADEPRLAIDYGSASTTAVVAWPDGRSTPIVFEGAGNALSSAVHVRPGEEVLVGAAAWRQAATDPDSFVEAPLRAGTGTVAVQGADVEVRDLMAATLRHVANEAARFVGAVPRDVRMVVPAGWGPRRRTWLRQAAYQAGLGQPHLIETPVAAADRLLALGVQLPVGAFILICDVGAGAEATVLRRGPTGFEVLSTLADLDAGGHRVDDLLTASILTTNAATLQGKRSRWTALASVRTAKEALSQLPAATVVLPPPAPAVVLTSSAVDDLARTVPQKTAELAARAVTAAELTTEQLSGVYCIGAAAAAPTVSKSIGERLGVVPQVLLDPGTVAVLGAAEAGGAGLAGAVLQPAPEPPVRRALAVALSGLASLELIRHFLLSASLHNGSRTFQRYGFYVLANWGELALAALFAVLACLAAGPLLGAGLSRARGADQLGPTPSPGTQIGTGILAAAAAGPAIAGLNAVIGAQYFGVATGPLLRWSLLPTLPITLIAVVLAVLAARYRRAPAQGWDDYLAFPMSTVFAGAVGMLLAQHSMVADRFPDQVIWINLTGRVGGILLGVGAACALASGFMLRAVIALPLALFNAVIVSSQSIGTLAVIFAIAVTLWWARRLWLLMRTPVLTATVSADLPLEPSRFGQIYAHTPAAGPGITGRQDANSPVRHDPEGRLPA